MALALVSMLGIGLAVPAGPAWAGQTPLDLEVDLLEPASVFDTVVNRYRSLEQYSDQVHLTHVVSRGGEEPHRVDTEFFCEVQSGELTVRTPGSQFGKILGWRSLFRTARGLGAVQQRHDLWLAPHMALRFANQPLEQFRPGVSSGFHPVEASPAFVEGRKLVRLTLRTGPELSRPGSAAFQLFVNPFTLLIERIEGEQRLPDRAILQTVMEILPLQFDSIESTRDLIDETPTSSPDPGFRFAPDSADPDWDHRSTPINPLVSQPSEPAPAPLDDNPPAGPKPLPPDPGPRTPGT